LKIEYSNPVNTVFTLHYAMLLPLLILFFSGKHELYFHKQLQLY